MMSTPRNPEKNPDDLSTGVEPMTGPQESHLKILCKESGEDFNPNLSQAEASRRIEELQKATGRAMPPESERPSEAAGEDFA